MSSLKFVASCALIDSANIHSYSQDRQSSTDSAMKFAQSVKKGLYRNNVFKCSIAFDLCCDVQAAPCENCGVEFMCLCTHDAPVHTCIHTHTHKCVVLKPLLCELFALVLGPVTDKPM